MRPHRALYGLLYRGVATAAITVPVDSSYHPNANGQELGYEPAFSAAAA